MQTLNGFKLLQEIDLLKLTLNAFYGNFTQLNKLIDIFENDPEIWSLQNRQKRDALCMEILRSFHNYSSSVSSRIDHMRNFKRKLNNQSINIFCKNEVKKLTTFEVVVFMKDLRNYIQHNELPFTKVTLSVKLIEEKNLYSWEPKLLLDRCKLLEWAGWKSKPKEYLNSYNNDIDLKLCCKEYHEKIEEFDLKFLKMVLDEYKNDLTEFKNFHEKINNLYPSSEV